MEIIDAPTRKMIKTALKARLITGIIKADNAFETLFEALKGAYTRAWDDALKDSLRDALNILRGMSDAEITNFGQAEADQIIAACESAAGPEAMQKALKGPILNYTDALIAQGIADAREAGVDIMFGMPDTESLAAIRKANMYWIGQHWDGYTHQQFQGILEQYFGQGMTRQQLADKFQEAFARFGERGAHYWELLADHTATKTREIGRVSAYQRAGIKKVRIRAQIDNRTTQICRRLNGKIVSVERMRTQMDAYIAACNENNSEAAKKAWPMMGDADAEKIPDGEKAPDGIGMPPYHFRCRTITVAEFG